MKWVTPVLINDVPHAELTATTKKGSRKRARRYVRRLKKEGKMAVAGPTTQKKNGTEGKPPVTLRLSIKARHKTAGHGR